MNPIRDPSEMPNKRPDDEQIEALVRSVTDEWRLPPQRLDLPTWRDRARTGAVERRGWITRLAVPVSTALVATAVLGFAAVWLSTPRDRGTVGQSPTAAPSLAPSATTGAVATPLPKLVRNGDLPSVTRVMVRSGGRLGLADLTTGTLGTDALGSYVGQTSLVPRPAGGWLCLCVNWTAVGATGPTGLSLTLVAVDATGRPGDAQEVRQIDGRPDPNQALGNQFQIVDAGSSIAADGKTAFFAWTARQGATGWTSGIDVIDVTSGRVVDSATVPAEQPAGTEGQPVSRNAPGVEVSPAGDRILISSFWYVEAPNDPNPPSGIDRWIAPLDGGKVGALTTPPAPATLACSAVELGGGFIDSTSYYRICGGATSDLTVRRVGVDGSSIGETAVPRSDGEFSAGSLVARFGENLFLWDPVSAVMARVDLATGALTTSPALGAKVDDGPFEALATLGRRLGRWIAPSVAAKLLLDPGIVVSADGARVYAIGVSSSSDPNARGSTGVFAFDAATLAPLGNWGPTADFTSLAISADGRFVYAAAQGGVDSAGQPAFANGSSITVFDVNDGSVRLIAGNLGSSDLWFVHSTLR